jgi:Fuc2NAc and GlcNAc transferase
LVDKPGDRSSHEGIVPRGGGVAVAVSFIGAAAVLWFNDALDTNVVVALIGSGGFVALIGFLDDHGHIAVGWRLLAHFVAAAWALFWLGGLPAPMDELSSPLFVWLLRTAALVYMVWLLNLYNFMDGIDGLAGIEALTVCSSGALLYFLVVPGSEYWVLPALLFAAVAGFLWWNYPSARIFLGDDGSGFLGITFAVFSVQAAWVSSDLFWAWNILLGTFFVDATVTLVRRALRGKKLHQAHRSHAYQHAARELGSHKYVSLAIGTINLVWLLPISVFVAENRVSGGVGLLVAYTPLVLLAWFYRAGLDDLVDHSSVVT